MAQRITFRGVRGSIATPGPQTAGIGGNTSSVEVELGGRRILLDGGTGLRTAGCGADNEPFEAYLLFGHLHWDHVQGVPFFPPLYDRHSRLTFVGPRGLLQTLDRQMAGPNFPVTFGAAPAARTIREIDPGVAFVIDPVAVTTEALRHPGGGIAYRLEHAGRSVVYAVDTEHPADGLDDGLLALARNADVLVYDGQYLPEEYAARRGWGHSTFERGAELARAARVGMLVLTHHDPGRDDLAVARLERRARELFGETRAAREGMTIDLADAGSRRDAPEGPPVLARAGTGA